MMRSSIVTEFSPLFAPETIAVVGASTSGSSPANQFIRRLLAFGYTGAIYPVHRSAAEIEGLPAFPTLKDTPKPVDYAYVAISAEKTPEMVSSTPPGWVRFVQVIASGFSETHNGHTLEQNLMSAVRAANMRLIGPNCLGTHSTSARLTFIENADPDPGSIGILSQSGGLSVDILRRGKNRGLGFSRLVTLGNCADVGVVELFDYLQADPETKVIGLYLESLTDGRAFFERLLRAGTRKPVVLLKGGRSAEGRRAAASHTGMLASDDKLWVALTRQTGTVLVDTLEQFLDVLLALQCLHPNPVHPTGRAVLFGNGGGTSVLGVDCLQSRGIAVPALGGAALEALQALNLPPGSSVQNPIDTPGSALRAENGHVGGRILAAIQRHADVDAVIMHLNVTVLLGYRNLDLLGHLVRAALKSHGESGHHKHFLMVLRSDGDPEVEAAKRDYRRQAVALGIPVFDEIANAAEALVAMRGLEAFRLSRQSPILSATAREAITVAHSNARCGASQ